MILLLPCAGLSSRFATKMPKWMLTHPSGKLMIQEAVAGISFDYISEVRMIVCKDQLKDGLTRNILLEVLQDCVPAGISIGVDVINLRTRSQAETVYASLLHNYSQNDVSFFVKDCDNHFGAKPRPSNSIAAYRVMPSDDIRRLQQKSFLQIDDLGMITSIKEKQIVSDLFSAGGYSFQSAHAYITAYQSTMAKKPQEGELFVSTVIQWMIDRGVIFAPMSVSDYQDWGTLKEWNDFKATFRTVVCDIDGVLLNNSSKYMTPRWGESEPILENIDALRSLPQERTKLILVTARPEEYREATEAQLKACGIRFSALIMGLFHAKRVLINDFNDATAPYPTAEAINLFRNDKRLGALIK